MLHIKFEYRDELSKGEWRKQECMVTSVKECIELYGLGVDCDYRIISVDKVNDTHEQKYNGRSEESEFKKKIR